MEYDPKVTDPFVEVKPVADDSSNEQPYVDRGSKRRSWAVIVLSGAAAATFVLLVNVAVLAWVKHGYQSTDGIATVYTGSCMSSKRAVVVADLFVNILSTILLAASNTCAQILASPSRSEVDNAHSRGKWLDIGVPSARNLGEIPSWRGWLWCLLFLSSVPLHLLYNSVVFYTSSAVDYQAALVTEDFVQGAWWNITRAKTTESISPPANIGQLVDIQANAGQLQMLSNAECLRAYATSMTEPNWRNVLVVTSLSLNDTLLTVWQHQAAGYDNDLKWPCDSIGAYIGDPSEASSCDVNRIIANSASWTIDPVQYCQHGGVWPNDHDTACRTFSAPIKYCLAEPFPPHCTVSISTSILAVVIVANILKIVAMVSTAMSKHMPLATVGDAIASFLTEPDATCEGKGTMSIRDVKKGRWQSDPASVRAELKPFKRKQQRWLRSASLWRWGLCIVLCCIVWGAALALLLMAIHSIASSSQDVSTGATLYTGSLGTSLISNVLLANLPQLVVSACYLFYNNVLTCMLLAHEYGDFAHERKGLRVSRPRGQQRTTYRLQLPYIYIVPLMAAMAVLHWLISRSLYLVQLSVYDNNGVAQPSRDVHVVGYSVDPLIASLALGGALILVLLGLSLRKLEPGMPLASSCSAAISAACSNSRAANEQDAAEKPLQYGVLLDRACDEEGRQYVGFSSGEVAPLQDGVVYL